MMEVKLVQVEQFHQALYFCKYGIVISEGVTWMEYCQMSVNPCNDACIVAVDVYRLRLLDG